MLNNLKLLNENFMKTFYIKSNPVVSKKDLNSHNTPYDYWCASLPSGSKNPRSKRKYVGNYQFCANEAAKNMSIEIIEAEDNEFLKFQENLQKTLTKVIGVSKELI